MHQYHKILVAVDLIAEDDDTVLLKAMDIAQSTGAEIILIHVVEFVYSHGAAWGPEGIAIWQETLKEKAKAALEKIGEKYQVPTSNQVVVLGYPQESILNTAESRKVDLIIIGNHKKNKIATFFMGSTSKWVLQHARCDVLSVDVRVKVGTKDYEQIQTTESLAISS